MVIPKRYNIVGTEVLKDTVIVILVMKIRSKVINYNQVDIICAYDSPLNEPV